MAAVDDIDHLIEHSRQESVTFFVDSSERDKLTFPDANRFCLTFSEPIRNVFGLEIMDAGIPSTMYVMDNNNNGLAYSHVFYNNGFTLEDFNQFFEELRQIKYFTDVFNAKDSANIMICVNTQNYQDIVNRSERVLQSNNIVFNRLEVTGLKIVEATNNVGFEYQGKTYQVLDNNQPLNLQPGLFSIDLPTGTIVSYEYAYISELDAQEQVRKGAAGAALYDVYVNNIYVEFEIGNYDLLSLFQYLNTYLSSIRPFQTSFGLDASSLSVQQTSQFGNLTKQNKFKFVFPGYTTLLLDMDKSSCDDVLGFSRFADSDSMQYSMVNSMYPKLYASRLSANGQQSIEPDGVVNLQGIRYILLRIPEIESHYLNSFAYGKYTPGIGMFKLASPNEVANLRFDFVNLIKKAFHPIGKLSKLTFDFTLPNGQPYDFKGVDYNLLINVKYYAPMPSKQQKDVRQKSKLNPNYKPDLIEYLYLQTETGASSSSSSPINATDLLKEHNKYGTS